MSDDFMLTIASVILFIVLFLVQLGLFCAIEKIFNIQIPQRWFIAGAISTIVCYLEFWRWL